MNTNIGFGKGHDISDWKKLAAEIITWESTDCFKLALNAHLLVWTLFYHLLRTTAHIFFFRFSFFNILLLHLKSCMDFIPLLWLIFIEQRNSYRHPPGHVSGRTNRRFPVTNLKKLGGVLGNQGAKNLTLHPISSHSLETEHRFQV